MQDIIERTIDLKAPIGTVWRALTDHREFGTWFRVDLSGAFAVGRVTHGVMTYPGYEGHRFWIRTERMDEPHLFSFRWPAEETAAPEAADDPTQTTLVEFRLSDIAGGTRLHLKESGFDGLPGTLRLQKFRDNEHGWTLQVENIRAHVEP